MALYRFTNFLSVVTALAINTPETCNAYPEVSIPQGTLQGMEITTRYGRIVYGFKGIPFAQPPVGDLRFRAPLAAAAWNGTLDATQDPSMCPQLNGDTVVGNEDCLYLNVYTPQLLTSNSSNPLAVMFWIHSGAFRKLDSTQAAPNYLLDKDVVLVAANYRLGPLGFLSTGDEVSPGNYGMKDQVLALQWIQNNIEYFGGDPDRVTIFGASSGSASVDLLALSDLTNGLYHQSIKVSGSPLSPRGYVPRDILAKHSFLLGEHLGCLNDTSDALVSCLREVNVTQIADPVAFFYEWKNYPDIIWRPTDEPDIEGAFITDCPENLYAAGKLKNLPSISGVTRDEGLYYTAQFYEDTELFNEFLEKIDDVMPYLLLYQYKEDVSNYTAALKSFYLNDLTADKNVLLANSTQLIGDLFYINPTYRANEIQVALGTHAAYFYSFDYLRSTKYSNDSVVPRGIQHSDNRPFFFPLNASCFESRSFDDCGMSEADFKMVDIMVDLWTSFAINGTPATSCDNGSITWSSYSSEDNYLRIGNGPELSLGMSDAFLKERMNFWEELDALLSEE